MSDYEEIMNCLIKLRDYCRAQNGCQTCKFGEFCDMNILAVSGAPTHWVFDGEEIICDG